MLSSYETGLENGCWPNTSTSSSLWVQGKQTWLAKCVHVVLAVTSAIICCMNILLIALAIWLGWWKADTATGQTCTDEASLGFAQTDVVNMLTR